MSDSNIKDAWYRPMLPRNPLEAHRASTPLELLFDLCFVVAVALAAARLHHALAEGHVGAALLSYPLVFFAIWWAWMNFSWFASAYDTDDVPYRIATLIQIAGALILAAGIPRAFDGGDFGVATLGYVVMRVALVAQWLRVARNDQVRRRTATRYVIGIVVCQAGWLFRLFLPNDLGLVASLVLVAAELAVPVWAERATPTPWHAGHITERYGLFTIIVLGESILAATIAIQTALDAGGASVALVVAALSGLLIVFAMWWVYFDQTAPVGLSSLQSTFVWGYGHPFIFASAAAVGAGLQVVIDTITGAAHVSTRAAGLALAIPVSIYLLTVWVLHARPRHWNLVETTASPLTALLVIAAAFTPWPPLLIALLLVARVALYVVAVPRDPLTVATAAH